MIEGQVNQRWEAIVPVTVTSSVTGNTVLVNAAIDTGFSDFLSLPFETIATLGLIPLGLVDVQLADGSVVGTRIFNADIEWHGMRHSIEVQLADGSPLLGMRMMNGSRLIISVREDGPVQIEEESTR